MVSLLSKGRLGVLEIARLSKRWKLAGVPFWVLRQRLVHHGHVAPICLLVWITGTLGAYTFAEEAAGLPDQALQPPQVFTNPEESRYSSSRRMFQGIPGIERAANGRLWVSRFSGSTGEGASSNHGLLITSDDDGATWSDLKVVVDLPGSRVRICDPCLRPSAPGKIWSD